MKALIIAMCLMLLPVFAMGNEIIFQEQTDNWLQSGYSGYGEGSLRSEGNGLIGDGETPTESPTIATGPIGDALPVLLLLSGAYLVYSMKKRRMKVRAC